MNVTFTGVDIHVSQLAIDTLIADPRVELGVLFSLSPDTIKDGTGKYPLWADMWRIIAMCKGRAAIHVCGTLARAKAFEMAGDLPVKRVQINGRIREEDVPGIAAIGKHCKVILQWHPALPAIMGDVPYEVLVDGSGGRGNLPAEWQRPPVDCPVGFAGGLGPDTIAQQLPLIRKVAVEPTWIDMETRIRKNGMFFPWACMDVLWAMDVEANND